MSGPVALYRHFDELATLLYVGVTTDPATRAHTHAQSSEWVQFAARGSIDWYSSETRALTAEVHAIRAERPVFNRLHSIGDPTERIEAYYARRGLRRPPWPPPPGHAIELLPLPAELVADGMTLGEALNEGVVSGSLEAVRRASTRPGFPALVGRRGPAHLYSRAELADWELGRSATVGGAS